MLFCSAISLLALFTESWLGLIKDVLFCRVLKEFRRFPYHSSLYCSLLLCLLNWLLNRIIESFWLILVKEVWSWILFWLRELFNNWAFKEINWFLAYFENWTRLHRSIWENTIALFVLLNIFFFRGLREITFAVFFSFLFWIEFRVNRLGFRIVINMWMIHLICPLS